MGQMDFGPHTVHIFVSLVVVLAAAGVALVCDLLKGNNEHLRELAVELKVRHEEAERRATMLEKRSKRVPDLSSVKPLVEAAPSEPLAAPAPAAVAAPPTPVAAPLPKPEPVQVPLPKVAASSPVETQRTARPERRRREMSPAVAAVAQAAAAIVNNNKESQHAFASASSASSEQTSTQATAASETRRKNWDSILKKTAPRQQGSVIPFESIREAVPAGFHDASVLQRSVESGRTISGLIVSIGTNGLSAQGSQEVSEYLQGLLTGQDFACQSGTDEYVVICGGEQGAGAQRRLSVIAEKLWDFQLRSIGGLGVQFSWGSFEARGERVGEAVATAIEQMQDTRQSRLGNMAKAV